MNDFWNYNNLDSITVFLLLFFAVFLLSMRSGKLLSNRLLAGFLVALALSYMDGVFLKMGYRFHYSYPHMVYVSMSFDFLVGPLLYLYLLSSIRPQFRLRPTHALLIVPFAMHAAFFTMKYHAQSEAAKRMLIDQNMVFSQNEVYWLTGLSNWFNVAFIGLVIFTLFRFRQSQKQDVLDGTIGAGQVVQTSWLITVSTGLLLATLMRYLNNLLWLGTPNAPILRTVDFKLFAIAGVFVFAATLVMWGLRRPSLFRAQKLKPARAKVGSDADLAHISAYMARQQPYIDPNLDLRKLALKLGMPAHKLSGILNTQVGQNFFDFVSRYRLKYCQDMLANEAFAEKTITEIMYEAGFNSKSVFNTLFKRETGQTPSAYRKSRLNMVQSATLSKS